MKTDSKVRLNLDLTPSAKRRLDKLQKATDSQSMVETIRRALALYELVVDHHAKDSRLIVRDAAGKELEIKLLL